MALYTDPEEIYLVRKDGHVMMYDATKMKETVKIRNPLLRSDNDPQVKVRCIINGVQRNLVEEGFGEDSLYK